MIVLGIETSCDESAVALYDTANGLIAHKIHSQIETHIPHGGVVPELASRDHSRFTLGLLDNLLDETGLARTDIQGVAYTAGPGLIGALMVGACLGHSLAWALDVPSIGVHHLEGHLLAPFLETETPSFPYLALLVSGGHSMLVDVLDIGKYEVLGETLDDAAGEAFDKVAKMLGLPYPGGPEISKLALSGDPTAFKLTRPMINRPGLEMSFSGLKTQVRNLWEASPQTNTDQANMAASFEMTICQTLALKCQRALKQTGRNQMVLTGGVSANRQLRAVLDEVCEKSGVGLFYPCPEFCTDNAAMIAYAGTQRLLFGERADAALEVSARWRFEQA